MLMSDERADRSQGKCLVSSTCCINHVNVVMATVLTKSNQKNKPHHATENWTSCWNVELIFCTSHYPVYRTFNIGIISIGAQYKSWSFNSRTRTLIKAVTDDVNTELCDNRSGMRLVEMNVYIQLIRIRVQIYNVKFYSKRKQGIRPITLSSVAFYDMLAWLLEHC